MKINGILTNKYTLLVLFLIALFIADVVLHKGMTRVLIPGPFIPEQKRTSDLQPCIRPLETAGKKWRKAVNTIEIANLLEKGLAGFEMDVYFDTIKNCLEVYHDSSQYSSLKITSILDIYKSSQLSASVWLDFKNLSLQNARQALRYIAGLQKAYKLENKLIIESSAAAPLQIFCDSGFFTSYYVPFFNPYLLTQNELNLPLRTILGNLQKYPPSSISGYYFQYPVLKKYFPSYPILTWSAKPGWSLVANVFDDRLLKDSSVKIVLYP